MRALSTEPLMTAANALTSEHKCEGNHKQDASCQHENFGGVKKFNDPWARLQFPNSLNGSQAAYS